MPSQVSRSRRCQLLLEKREQLRRCVAQHVQQNRALQLRHNLLQAWCDCLSLIQLNMSPHCSQWDSSADARQEFERLLAAEVSLLNHLTSSPGFIQQSLSVVKLDVGVDTIAPAGDPMWYFKHHIKQPPMAGAETITLQDLAEIMRESTLQLSVQLHIMQDSPLDQHAEAKAGVMVALDRVVHIAVTLVMVGREDLVEAANIVNLQTLEPNVEGAAKQAAMTATLIGRLGITPQQEQLIATGSAMYMQLLASVMQERQRLQLQFADGKRSSCSSSSSSGASTAMSSIELLKKDLLQGRQQKLEAQSKQAARLQMLIRKEMMLRMAGMTWFLGCMSAQQVAKACVLCWPYTLRPSLLAQEIMRRAQGAQSGTPQSQPDRA